VVIVYFLQAVFTDGSSGGLSGRYENVCVVLIRQLSDNAGQCPWVAFAAAVFDLILFDKLRHQSIGGCDVNRVTAQAVGIVNRDASACTLRFDS
jgi:hypothetical protein